MRSKLTGHGGEVQWLCEASTAATLPLMQVGVNHLDSVYGLSPLAWAAIKGHKVLFPQPNVQCRGRI